MYKFVRDNVGGVGSRRKLTNTTCDSCKKRHKRCLHNRSLAEAIQLDKSDAANVAHPRVGTPHLHVVDEEAGDDMDGCASARETQPLSGRHYPHSPQPKERCPDRSVGRFIGNLSPEASFFATGTSPTHIEDQRTNVGVWLVARQPTPTHQPDLIGNTDEQDSTFFPLSNSLELQRLFLHLQNGALSVLPPERELSLMSDLYYEKFDPMFPIIHGEKLDRLHNAEALAIKQCICLIASLDPSMKPHLRLSHVEGVMTQGGFRSYIAEALKSILHTRIIQNKVTLLQITALLAFFVEEPSSSEISSYYCAQAVEISQTLGLHVSYPDESQALEKSQRLYWCIWALDRLNAATNGRPILIHEQDTGEQLLNYVPESLPSFRLFLRVCKLLDEVISQYRPRPVFHADLLRRVVPDFESLVCEATATDVSSSLMASLEVLYLSVRILACRPQTQSGGPNQQPSSDAQSSCAASILSIVADDIKHSMTYWAVLPYAVSLASSVEYQTLRNSRISHNRKRAYKYFRQSHDILEDLSETFISARMMARLSQGTLQGAGKPRSPISRVRENNDLPSSNTRNEQSPDGVLQPSSVNPISPNLMDSSHMQPNYLGDMYPPNANEFGLTHDFSPSEINNIFDGLYGNLDLSRVDTLFSTNLNPTMPLQPTEWMDF